MATRDKHFYMLHTVMHFLLDGDKSSLTIVKLWKKKHTSLNAFGNPGSLEECFIISWACSPKLRRG